MRTTELYERFTHFTTRKIYYDFAHIKTGIYCNVVKIVWSTAPVENLKYVIKKELFVRATFLSPREFQFKWTTRVEKTIAILRICVKRPWKKKKICEIVQINGKKIILHLLGTNTINTSDIMGIQKQKSYINIRVQYIYIYKHDQFLFFSLG